MKSTPSTLGFKRIGFAIGLILVLILSNTAMADDGVTLQHTDPRWQAQYWNNTFLSGEPVLRQQEANLNYDWGSGSPHFRVEADHFSARWTRYIDVTPGPYRFTVTSDDGIRVWVDSDLIIDQWHDHPPTTYTAQAYLGEGHHLVKVEYYERGGGAVAKVSWTLATDTSQQWQGEYYNNKTLSGTPSLVRDDQEINFSWGSGSPAPGQVNADVFSARWTRNLDLATGNYRFRMTVDDGARLYVNGHLLIDAWKDQPPTTYSGDIYLPGGSITVQLEYYENQGGATAQLSWENTAPADWQTYSNPYFGITLKYPADWQPVPGYGDPESGEKYAGTDGFFMINAMDGESIDSVAAAEANHVLQPYGSQPTIESLQIQGQEARLILPSADANMEDQSALIVRYPQPVTIAGHAYPFFVLYADQNHVRAIGETLRFTENPPPTGVIVDDTDAGFVKNGSPTGWHTAAEGYGGHLTWTRNNNQRRDNYNWARWYPDLASARYEVFVYIPDRYSTTSGARYWVSHRDGYTLRLVDQSANGGRWVSLGAYWFRGTNDDHVSLSDVTYEPYLSRLIAFDAVKWVPSNADLHWDTNPNTLIIRHWESYRASVYSVATLIPPLQVWGDGRIIWLSDGYVHYQRRMMAGYLTQNQMRELLQRIVNAGFYDWEETYYSAAPDPYTILAVNLASHSEQPRKVHVDLPSAPEGFVELIEFLEGVPATVVDARPYVPDRAYLTAWPTDAEPTEQTPQWPDASYDLDQAANGIYIEGDSLAFAWGLVNENPSVPLYVRFNGRVYGFTLSVPDVSVCAEPHPAFEVIPSCH